MKIDTGMRTVTSTASKNAYILYQCHACGKDVLEQYHLIASASGGYHNLQSNQTKNAVSRDAANSASYALTQQDDRMYKLINKEKDYNNFYENYRCPHCETLQVWSGMPNKWVKSLFFVPWIILLLVTLFFAVCGCMYGMPYLVIPPLLLIALPFIRRYKRNKHIQQRNETKFRSPVYYNHTNIKELINGPHRDLLLPYLKTKESGRTFPSL